MPYGRSHPALRRYDRRPPPMRPLRFLLSAKRHSPDLPTTNVRRRTPTPRHPTSTRWAVTRHRQTAHRTLHRRTPRNSRRRTQNLRHTSRRPHPLRSHQPEHRPVDQPRRQSHHLQKSLAHPRRPHTHWPTSTRPPPQRRHQLNHIILAQKIGNEQQRQTLQGLTQSRTRTNDRRLHPCAKIPRIKSPRLAQVRSSQDRQTRFHGLLRRCPERHRPRSPRHYPRTSQRLRDRSAHSLHAWRNHHRFLPLRINHRQRHRRFIQPAQFISGSIPSPHKKIIVSITAQQAGPGLPTDRTVSSSKPRAQPSERTESPALCWRHSNHRPKRNLPSPARHHARSHRLPHTRTTNPRRTSPQLAQGRIRAARPPTLLCPRLNHPPQHCPRPPADSHATQSRPRPRPRKSRKIRPRNHRRLHHLITLHKINWPGLVEKT